ncbi:type VI secretion system protein [Rubripirellula reticaptiva]|uniref:Type VI secretion system component TssM1 N-terminal domain-containing protein n=1 Tax=Rubripirellula reticaptiva TaxID=2528013 RepID=A0A5C6F3A8_9BACT|nr:type VI secretion system protein [Rubripirellula reticaptiva]TWU56293.1 hypothetical protein Poly59_25970 [Rubripirellula reticaptiva]
MPDDAQPSLVDRVKSRLNFSLAAIVASLVGVFLLCLALVAWLIYSVDPTRIAWGDYMTIERSAGLLVLWVLSCGVTYLTVRTWMSDVPPGDVRVRDGWSAGVKLLSRHGLALDGIPCFVVLGCETRHQQDALVGTDGFSTTHSASGAAPAIDWHVTEERILVFCRDIGVYGGLLRSGELDADDEPTPIRVNSKSFDAKQVAADAFDDATAETKEDVMSLGATDHELSAGRPLQSDATESDSSRAAVAVVEPRVGSKSMTLQPDAVTSAMQTLDHARSLVLDAQSIIPESAPVRSIPDSLSSTKTTKCQDQLSQFCTRLRAERFPHAAINGTLVIVDSDTLTDRSSGNGEAGRTLGRAIRSDLDQMQAELGIVSPVTMMVVENNHADDYRELQRRLRMVEKETALPLGRSFVSEEIPTVDAMNELANDTVRMIESRVQQVFQIPRSLTQPQNHRLVRVLIQCRRWRSSLRSLLVESCAVNSVPQSLASHAGGSGADAGIVSGLFVASSGAGSSGGTTKTGSFFDPVVKHMIAQQNHLTWTAAQRRRWRNQRHVANAIVFTTLALLLLLLAQLWKATWS